MFLRGSVAILSGAGRRRSVGAATAKMLASKGCNVLINCLQSEEQAKSVIHECKAFNIDAEYFIGDVTQPDICKAMAKFAQDKWGRADVLVNCVGVTKNASYEKLDDLTSEDFAKLLAVNITAPYMMAQAFQHLLRASKNGVIVNVSSAAGISGKGSSIAYAAAKGGENTLTLALAQAFSPEVRVNAVCPSFVDSSWWEESFKDRQDKYLALIKSMQDSNLLNRVLKPEDVALTIMSIIENPLMTGELIRLDAGAHIGKSTPRTPSLKK